MRWTVLSLFVLLASCAFGPHFEAPKLDVVGLELLDSDFLHQRLKVRLNVQNPNNRELPVKGVSCDLEIEGERLASGVSDAEFTVPAFGQQEFEMTVDANMAVALLRLLGRKDSERNEVSYRITGKVNLASGLLRSIPFSEEGSLPLGNVAK